MSQFQSPAWFDSTSFQKSVRELTQEVYAPVIPDLQWLKGHPINRLFRPESEIATQVNGGINVQMVTDRPVKGRSSSNPLQDAPTGGEAGADKIKIRFDIANNANMDMVATEASTGVPIFDFMDSENDVWRVAEKAQEDVFNTLDYYGAVKIHTDRDGKVWDVSAVKGPLDADMTYAGAPSYTAGDTSITFLVGGGLGIGVARRGVELDFYNTSTGALLVSNAKIDGNPLYGEDAVPVTLTADSKDGNGGVVTDFDAVDAAATAGNLGVYLTGTKGAGYKGSLAELFKESYTNDNWFDGRDRGNAKSSHFIPHRTRVGATKVPLELRHLDSALQLAGNQVNHQQQFNPVMVAGLKTMDRFRRDVASEVITNESAVDRGDYTIGDHIVSYVHPNINGKVGMMSDNFAREDRVYLINPEDTQRYYGGFRGPIPTVDWMQRPGSSGSGTFSKFWDYSVMQVDTPFMRIALRSVAIFNIE